MDDTQNAKIARVTEKSLVIGVHVGGETRRKKACEIAKKFGEEYGMENEKIIENMIRWAKGKLGCGNYAGWCLSFIEDALEISNDIEIFGGDSARESFEMYQDSVRTDTPAKGAFVFYDCLCPSEEGLVNWGHCGICLGEGKIIHAWDVVRIDDYLNIEKMVALSGDHPKYLGWVSVERVMAQEG